SSGRKAGFCTTSAISSSALGSVSVRQLRWTLEVSREVPALRCAARSSTSSANFAAERDLVPSSTMSDTNSARPGFSFGSPSTPPPEALPAPRASWTPPASRCRPRRWPSLPGGASSPLSFRAGGLLGRGNHVELDALGGNEDLVREGLDGCGRHRAVSRDVPGQVSRITEEHLVVVEQVRLPAESADALHRSQAAGDDVALGALHFLRSRAMLLEIEQDLGDLRPDLVEAMAMGRGDGDLEP